MFADNVVLEITRVAQGLGVEPAALLAVAEVESGGVAFVDIAGRREPLIRFEAHYFDKRLSEKNRTLARAQGLASSVAGAIANPKAQSERWRMLEKAAAIDAKAAYESVSWGLGQVMGAHWKWLGYRNVDALVAEARSGVAGQARLMALYIDKAGLTKALLNHDWESFAHGYNGPAYAKSGYDHKLAAAYATYAKAGGNSSLLRQGSKGDAVAQLQRNLALLGYPLVADGIFGPATARALRRFQADHALAVDGIAGPRTMAELRNAGASSDGSQNPPSKNVWARLVGWLTWLLHRA
jgi:hypothetical protein